MRIPYDRLGHVLRAGLTRARSGARTGSVHLGKGVRIGATHLGRGLKSGSVHLGRGLRTGSIYLGRGARSGAVHVRAGVREASAQGFFRSVGRRLSGLALILLAIGPGVVVVACVLLIGSYVMEAVRLTEQKVGAIASIVTDRIGPQIEEIQVNYARVTKQFDDVKTQISKAMNTITKLEDIQIGAGQFGRTSELRIRVPDRGFSVGSGPIKVSIDNGELFDQTLPSVPIPASAIKVPITPLRQAFEPLGPNGPIGKAFEASQAELQKTIGHVTELKRPLDDIRSTALDWLAPIAAWGSAIGAIVYFSVIALLLLLLLYLVAAVWLAMFRRRESAAAYLTGGEIGYLFYVYRTMLFGGFARLRNRTPPMSAERALQEMQETVRRLEAEITTLRTDLGSARAAAAE